MTVKHEIQTEALQLFSAEEASYYRLLPCRKESGNRVTCLGEEGLDYSETIAEIKSIYGFDIIIETVRTEELTRLSGSYYRLRADVPADGTSTAMTDVTLSKSASGNSSG